MYAGIELGGTKIDCVLGNQKGEIISRTQFKTTTPKKTISLIHNFFSSLQLEGDLKGVGIACFGPLDLNHNSQNFGSITETTKIAWSNYPILNEIAKIFPSIPIRINTDVNAGALAEYLWGNHGEINNLVYLTIGTGVGGGVIINGKLLHGDIHPEIGHMRIPHLSEDPYQGICVFHQDCFEGMASGPAIMNRWGKNPKELPEDHQAWEIEAYYIAMGITNLYFSLGIEKFILGGGVMKQPHLFSMVRDKFDKLVNKYGNANHSPPVEEMIVPSSIKPSTGIAGAIALAITAKQA